MIHHKIDQRSPEWFALRCGIPTSSEFHRIVTPTGKASAQAEAYMYTLLAEWMIGHPITGPETDWMARGTEMESEAVLAYEFQTETRTESGGFWTLDDGMVGCSPDRLVGDDGVLEIKCPKHNTQVGYLLSGQLEADYRPQLQGQLWIMERQWVDICAYHPEMPAKVMRVNRDDKYIDLLSRAVLTFVDVLLRNRALLEDLYGPFVRSAPAEPTDDKPGALGISDADADAIVNSWLEGA